VLGNLNGLPAAFTDRTPSAIALTGSVQLRDEKQAADIVMQMVAGADLFKICDLNQAMVSVCYDLHKDSAEQARYQWQRFWAAVNLLQFLPLMYAWTPASKHDGTAAGLLWPDLQNQQAEQKFNEVPDWFEQLDQPIADLLSAKNINWLEPGVVGEAVMNVNNEVIGEAEILFYEGKIAFLLEESDDQMASKSYLQAEGWRVCSSVDDLAAAINELDSGD